jgi:copper chaperone CopZ
MISATDSAWEVRRRIRVPALRDKAGKAAAERALTNVDGVRGVSVVPEKSRVVVDYLVTKTDYQSLEGALEAAGVSPAAGRWARFKSGWYQNLKLTGRDNASAPAASCCSKPPIPPSRTDRH